MSDYSDQSNYARIESWKKELIDSWVFTRPGEDQSLGRDMAGDVAQGIHDRTIEDQRDATGSPLKPNKDPYKTWKEVKLGVYQPLVKTGQMLSLTSLLGDVTVTDDEILMKYGTGEPPSRSASPSGSLSNQDASVTDRQKAEWNSEERPFFALDDKIVEALMDRAGDAFDKAARENS